MSDGITDSQRGLKAYLFGKRGRLPNKSKEKLRKEGIKIPEKCSDCGKPYHSGYCK